MGASDATRLLDCTQRWQDGAALPPKSSPHELRPFLPERHPSSTMAYWDPPESPYWYADRVKHHLLYCHGLVLPSPLADIAQNAVAFGLRDARFLLVRHLAALNQLAPLVEAGVVSYVPRYVELADPDHWMARSDRFRREINDAMGEPAGERFHAFVAPLVPELALDDYPPFGYASNTAAFPFDPGLDGGRVHLVFQAYNYITESFGLALTSDGAVDPLLAYKHQHQVLQRLVSYGAVGHDSDRLPTALLSDLLTIQLPDLGSLDARDVVALRASEPTFEAWRSGLSRSLATLRTLGPSLSEGDKRYLIAEELAETAAKLRSDLQRQRVGSLVRAATQDFSIGAIGVVSGAVIGGTVGVATGASLVGLAIRHALQKAVERSNSGSASTAFLGHYAVFR